ncbi:uncharacterized protein LOC6576008 [Drosophila mojavensis]|uniref:Uncharacterized protein n=1 Tax=Drosophila mojavensis TaxID=7230 RepID=B4KJK9_DROMO|nr:uncharacterized protein LOC6576008 [Drosophila mojavensis]EDW11454.2 uncharacterized protein Dmoj_GI17148 [Drosophila mojavensis]
MTNKRRKSNKAKRKPNLFKCRARSLDQLKRWEYLRFQSALNAAANLHKELQSTARPSDDQLGIDQSLLENRFTCACLMLTLMLISFMQGTYSAIRRKLGLKAKPQTG